MVLRALKIATSVEWRLLPSSLSRTFWPSMDGQQVPQVSISAEGMTVKVPSAKGVQVVCSIIKTKKGNLVTTTVSLSRSASPPCVLSLSLACRRAQVFAKIARQLHMFSLSLSVSLPPSLPLHLPLSRSLALRPLNVLSLSFSRVP
jgi:hypothetical protein